MELIIIQTMDSPDVTVGLLNSVIGFGKCTLA
jgi:hypothetical protein